MSTVPRNDAWRDAGLAEPDDEVVSLVEEVEDPGPGVEDTEHEIDEYTPRTPRPDLEGEANEADVVEQASTVPTDDDDYA